MPKINRTTGRQREEQEFTERVLEINRVTRVVKGGKRMRFRALVVIGDNKGRVGWGVGKAADVSGAIAKAVAAAKKQVITIISQGSTIPYPIRGSFKGAKILLKPATPGTGIIAGGSMRTVLQLSGIKDIMGKALGSQNKMSNTIATVKTLGSIISPDELDKARGRTRGKRPTKAKVTPQDSHLVSKKK